MENVQRLFFFFVLLFYDVTCFKNMSMLTFTVNIYIYIYNLIKLFPGETRLMHRGCRQSINLLGYLSYTVGLHDYYSYDLRVTILCTFTSVSHFKKAL